MGKFIFAFKIFVSISLLSFFDLGAKADYYRITPQYGGGYNIYGNGGTRRVRPNFGGGYNIYGNGRTTRVRPNFGGGFNIFR